jgi:hypothetical protein
MRITMTYQKILVYSDGIEYFAKFNISIRYENEHSHHDLLIVHIHSKMLYCFCLCFSSGAPLDRN